MFNSTFRYIDDLISFGNPKFGEFISEIYPKELELKETTESSNGCSYLDLFLFKDDNNCIRTKIYDKRDDFSFEIINYPHLTSNIPARPAYGVYVSRLVAFGRGCSYLSDFVYRHDMLVKKLVTQGYCLKFLRKVFKKFAVKHHGLLVKYELNIQSFIRQHLSL